MSLEKISQNTMEIKMNYYKFTEVNDWEGETWNFWIREDLRNQLRLMLPKNFNDIQESYTFSDNPVPENEVDILVKHGGSGYMKYHNKIDSFKAEWVKDVERFAKEVLDGDFSSDPFNKGYLFMYKNY